jgi:hypothetical protein
MSSTFNQARSTLRKPQRSFAVPPVIHNNPLLPVFKPKEGNRELSRVKLALAVHGACGRDPKACAESLCDFCDKTGFVPARLARWV